jgi:hypothetical protein
VSNVPPPSWSNLYVDKWLDQQGRLHTDGSYPSFVRYSAVGESLPARKRGKIVEESYHRSGVPYKSRLYLRSEFPMLEPNYNYIEHQVAGKSREQIWHLNFEAGTENSLFVEIPSFPNIIGYGWGKGQQSPDTNVTIFSFARAGGLPSLVFYDITDQLNPVLVEEHWVKCNHHHRSGDQPALINHIVPAKMWFQAGILHRLDDAAIIIGDQFGYFYKGAKIDPLDLLGKRAKHTKIVDYQ